MVAVVVARTRPRRWLALVGAALALIAIVLYRVTPRGAIDLLTGLTLGVGIGLAVPWGWSGRGAPGRQGRRDIAIATTGSLLSIALVLWVAANDPTVEWFGHIRTHGDRHDSRVALTFDDGPDDPFTLEISKVLDDHGVKGTFFEVGKAIDAEPRITRALYEHGQLLGNHSYEHDQWRWLDPRYPELERTQKAFRRAIGTCPAYYRPPHGDRTPFIAHVVNDHRMRIIMWNVSANDWAEKNPRTIARNIVSRAKPGSIILLHDGLDGRPSVDRTVLVRALPLILDGLRTKHLRPVGLDELIGGPAYIPC